MTLKNLFTGFGMMLKVNGLLCDACATCVAVCPHDALRLDAALAIDHRRCVRCGACVKICPFGALALIDEHKEAGVVQQP